MGFHDRSSAGQGTDGCTGGIRRADRGYGMSDQEQADLRLMVARLRQEHTDYDVAINAMIATGCEPLRIQRMKKKKLALKDRITKLEDQIIPDIIA